MRTPIRNAVIGFITANCLPAISGIPVVFDDDPFDWSFPPNRFIHIQTVFNTARQLNMSAAPKSRISGAVYITHCNKVGQGEVLAATALDAVSGPLEYAIVLATGYRVNFREMEPLDLGSPPGWHYVENRSRFYADPA